MTYTLGTAHSLSGSGSVAIASPIGLKIALATLPAFVSRRDGTPLEYSSLGWLAIGNADGYLPRMVLHHAAQLAYPVADGMTLLGYSLKSGTTATVTELLAVPPPNSSLAPWDRGAAVWTATHAAVVTGPTTNVVNFTYTVPAGKILMIGELFLHLVRGSVATTASNANIQALVNGVQVLLAAGYSNVLNVEVDSRLAAGPVYLQAGDVLTSSVFSADTGGLWLATLGAVGTLFNA